jgi:predicted DNA-binding transcriptional regulator AlpA
MIARKDRKVVICQQLCAEIRRRGLTWDQAKDVLEVSRQSIYLYMNNRVHPRAIVLEKACSAWGMQFEVDGVQLTRADFGTASTPQRSDPDQQLQLTLESVEKALGNVTGRINAKPVSKNEIEITIRIAI